MMNVLQKDSVNWLKISIISLVLGVCQLANTPAAFADAGSRPERWAVPIQGIAGLPNMHRVNSSLYRSAQPTREGFEFLVQGKGLFKGDQPIQTIVSLRAFNDDAPIVPANNVLRLEQIRFKTWHPEDEDVIKFLRIANTKSLQPILVHCQHGADRTGTMVAIYRIAYEGWSKQQAIEEMTHGGFGYHPIWKNLLGYIDALDISAIKAQVEKQGDWK